MNICLDFLVPFWCQEMESSAEICHIPCLMLTFMTLSYCKILCLSEISLFIIHYMTYLAVTEGTKIWTYFINRCPLISIISITSLPINANLCKIHWFIKLQIFYKNI